MVSVHRIAVTMTLAVISAMLNHANSSASASSLPWYDCAQYTLSDEAALQANATLGAGSAAECAVVQAPLCHEGVCERATNATIDLFVKRIISDETTQGKPNVILLQGGTGAASTQLELIMTKINKVLGGKVNTYTMDHRGSGRSTKLECVAAQAQATGSPKGISIALEEVAECARELQAKYDGDLSPFSVTSAANDLKYFIANHLAGQETYVYGVGFGTLTVERLMHLNPVGVKGYILDGVMTTSGASKQEGYYLSELDVTMDAVAKSFLKMCDDDKENCGKYFPNTLATAIEEMLVKLQTLGPDQGFFCTLDFDSYSDDPLVDTSARAGVRNALSKLIQQPTLRHLIPVLVYRVNRCQSMEFDDPRISYSITQAAKAFDSTSEQQVWMTSELLRDLIVYSELWASPSPSQSQMDERSKQIAFANPADLRKYCAFTKDATASCGSYHDKYGSYTASPISYKRDKYYNTTASLPSNVSVLVLSGTLDPVTPHKFAETLYKTLDAGNKQLVAFELAAHGQLWRNDTNCMLDILRSYLAASGDLTKLDSSCAASTADVSFAYDRETLEELLEADSKNGADGAFNGRWVYEDGTQPSPYLTPFVIVASVLGIAIIALVVLRYKVRVARRKKAASTDPSTSEPLTASAQETDNDLEQQAPATTEEAVRTQDKQ